MDIMCSYFCFSLSSCLLCPLSICSCTTSSAASCFFWGQCFLHLLQLKKRVLSLNLIDVSDVTGLSHYYNGSSRKGTSIGISTIKHNFSLLLKGRMVIMHVENGSVRKNMNLGFDILL